MLPDWIDCTNCGITVRFGKPHTSEWMYPDGTPVKNAEQVAARIKRIIELHYVGANVNVEVTQFPEDYLGTAEGNQQGAYDYIAQDLHSSIADIQKQAILEVFEGESVVA